MEIKRYIGKINSISTYLNSLKKISICIFIFIFLQIMTRYILIMQNSQHILDILMQRDSKYHGCCYYLSAAKLSNHSAIKHLHNITNRYHSR